LVAIVVRWREDRCISENITEEEDFQETSEMKGLEENIYYEKIESGSVKFKIYKKYVTLGGGSPNNKICKSRKYFNSRI
jgi:hypothetical protein